jgi:hypothetical protein
MQEVSVFNNAKSPRSLGKVKIDYVLNAISNYDSKHVQNVIKAREILKNEGENAYKSFKSSKIPVVTWNGIFSRRSNSNLIQFSDHIYLDVDNVNPDDVKENLSKIPIVTAAWTSVSSSGVGFLVKTEGIKRQTFKSTISSLHKYFEERDVHTDMLTDIARCNILSYDSNIYINDKVEIYEPVEPIVELKQFSTNGFKSENITACNISFAYTIKKGLSFIPDQRHNFTVTYFGMCNQFGVPLNEAYQFAMENNCTSNVTYKKAEQVYDKWSNQHGIKQVNYE